MSDYFKPLRRKFGAVTLLVALILMAGWVRGLSFREEFTFGRDARRPGDDAYEFHQLIFADDLKLRRFEVKSANDGLRDGWKSYPTRESDYFFSTGTSVHRWRYYGFGFEERRTNNNHVRLLVWIIPFWAIVFPLTLLSAYLLLSSPRKSTSAKIAEPVPVRTA